MKEQDQEIDLTRLFYLLLSKLHFIVLAVVVGAICGYAVAKLVMSEKYTSSISIFVNNSTDGTSSDGEKVNAADLTAAQQLASTYIVILQDDVVYEEVSKLLVEDYDLSDLSRVFTITYDDGQASISPGQIKSLVTIEAVNDTEVISITAVTKNPELSADICTYIANIAPELLTRTTHAGSVESIGTAKVPSSPSSPNVNKVTMVGGMLGLVLAAAIIIIRDLMDNRIKTAEDFKRKFPDIPVLTEIGDLEYTYKGHKGYKGYKGYGSSYYKGGNDSE